MEKPLSVLHWAILKQSIPLSYFLLNNGTQFMILCVCNRLFQILLEIREIQSDQSPLLYSLRLLLFLNLKSGKAAF